MLDQEIRNLLTVKAFRKLKEAPVIAFPKKRKGSKSYAQRIIDVYLTPGEKEMLGLVFPMTKDPVILEREWTNTVELVWEKLKTGKDVAFVTEGDPLLIQYVYSYDEPIQGTLSRSKDSDCSWHFLN